jgi:hypothetical protein
MTMKRTVSFTDFLDAFSEERRNTYSYEGKKALFEFLEEYEESTGEETELDIIALCCEFTEYENLEELKGNYDKIESMEDLEDHTTVIPIEGTDRFIIQDF